MIETSISETNLKINQKIKISWVAQVGTSGGLSNPFPSFYFRRTSAIYLAQDRIGNPLGFHVPTGFYSTVGQRLANWYRASLSIIQVLIQMY